jgi:hypothetical protein
MVAVSEKENAELRLKVEHLSDQLKRFELELTRAERDGDDQ